MANTIEMQDMRFLNLFWNVTKVKTRYILKYNNMYIFCVPKQMLSKAIGKDLENLKRLSDKLGKRVRVIPIPKGIQHAKEFLLAVVNPSTFKDLEIKGDEIVITAGGTQDRAKLFGRNKMRYIELQKIVRDFFGKELKIV